MTTPLMNMYVKSPSNWKSLGNDVLSLLCLIFVLFGTSCKPGGSESASEPVTWPELSNLDEVIIQVEGSARDEDIASVRESRAAFIEAAAAVTADSVPTNAANPKRVETLLTDLNALVDELSSDLDDESLIQLISGFHPVIENLIEAAGMPHVHTHEEHSHEEHSHEEHSHEEHSHEEHSHEEESHDHP